MKLDGRGIGTATPPATLETVLPCEPARPRGEELGDATHWSMLLGVKKGDKNHPRGASGEGPSSLSKQPLPNRQSTRKEVWTAGRPVGVVNCNPAGPKDR